MHFYANCSFFARNSDAAIDAVVKNGKFLTFRWRSALHRDSTFQNDFQLIHEIIHQNIWRMGIKTADLEIREFSWRKTTTPDVLATVQNNSRENLTH